MASRGPLERGLWCQARISFDQLKAEGVKIPTETLVAELSDAVADMKHAEVRSTVIGHIVRGGNPTYRDRMLASRFGLVAV